MVSVRVELVALIKIEVLYLTLEVETYETMPCELQTFRINGIDAELEDFGVVVKEDFGGYECTDLRFEEGEQPPLKKYNLTYDDYDEICRVLSDTFKIGRCDWCR